VHKYIALFIFIWAIAAIAGSFSVGSNLMDNETVSSPVQDVMYYSQTVTQTDAGPVAMAGAAVSFFGAVLRILFLDFPVFHEGPWVVLRWVILAPLIGAVIYGIIATFTGVLQRQV
jgi:hypothetical protein